ncbi:PAS domain-containing sensor histidine kinase [Thermodesulfobacteriota bacterium]
MPATTPRGISPAIPPEEAKKRKRERVLIVLIVGTVALLTYAETRIIRFGTGIPVSNTILMFIAININLLLLILLFFLVVRNLVKLLYERRRGILGAGLRTKLVLSFITLSLVPAIVLFFFSIQFITSSIEFWFNVPVEQSLENSLRVGKELYQHHESNNRFFLERIAYQLRVRKLLSQEHRKELNRYVIISQRAFNLDAVEVYTPQFLRLATAESDKLDERELPVLSSDVFRRGSVSSEATIVTPLKPSGELIRTVATIPYGAPVDRALGFVAVSAFIKPDLTHKLASISRGFEEYQQIKMLKKPIQISHYLTLSIAACLIVFCAIWFGFYLAKSITIPIQELAEGTRKVAEGNLGFTIAKMADDEMGSLVDSFNKMTRDLRMGREQLELSAHQLAEQNLEIEERRQYMEIVLKNVSTGVISFDANGFVTTINKSAEKMLGIDAGTVLNQSYKRLLKGQHLDLAREVMQEVLHAAERFAQLPLRLTVNGRPRSFVVHVTALKDDAQRYMGMVVVFDDLTELERAQRLAAWREVARRIAHEVKNPLTPIRLSAQRLVRKYDHSLNDPVFSECARTIIDQVDLIRDLVNEFSAFARFPVPRPETCDLPPLIEEACTPYREGHPEIRFETRITNPIPKVTVDSRQIKRAMINLINNAMAAMEGAGSIIITLAHDERLQRVSIEVADSGKGVSREEKLRLFEPYFSTKRAGMGLGLAIVSTIVADHNGRIRVEDNQPTGAKFIIELPA